jgi:hypothetical protein
MNVGETRIFAISTSETGADRYFAALQKEAKAETEWQLTYWRDQKGRLCALRSDGMSQKEIDEVRSTKSELNQPDGEPRVWCPLTWYKALGISGSKDTRMVHQLSKRGVSKCPHGWHLMDVGEQKLVHTAWTTLHTSLKTQMVRRELPWTFRIRERPELADERPTKKWASRYWEITRIN